MEPPFNDIPSRPFLLEAGAKSGYGQGEKKKRGRPPIIVDLRQVEALSAMQCSPVEIAAFLGISFKEFETRRARKGHDGEAFRDAYDRGRAKGRISVRRAQFELLQKGNVYMAIHLGKNILGQKDSPDDQSPGGARNFLYQLQDQLKQGPSKIQVPSLEELQKAAAASEAPPGNVGNGSPA